VDAGDGLLRIPGVYFILRLAIFFRDGEDAQSLEGFERVGGFWVEHANANVQIVTAVEKAQN
jgi:hypothetical protein